MKPIVKPPSLPAPKVEIINLIDVLITLIAFFLFTTVFAAKQSQIKLSLPAAAGGEPVAKAAGVEISLTKANQIYLAGRKIRPEELTAYLKSNCRSDALVMIKADRDCKYEWVIALLEKVKSSGLSQVGLRVLPR